MSLVIHSVTDVAVLCYGKQSRSSLYAEYASCVGPPKHLALKDDFILVSFLIWPARQ